MGLCNSLEEYPTLLRRLARHMGIRICILLFGFCFSGSESGLTIPRDISSKITFKFLVIGIWRRCIITTQ